MMPMPKRSDEFSRFNALVGKVVSAPKEVVENLKAEKKKAKRPKGKKPPKD